MDFPSLPAPPSRVLVVDDDPDLREILLLMLEGAGHGPLRGVPDAESALGVLRDEGPYDLVVSDLGLPALDGAWLRERVAERHPEVGFVLISGDASRLAALSLGSPCLVLAKPFGRADLERVVARGLAARACA